MNKDLTGRRLVVTAVCSVALLFLFVGNATAVVSRLLWKSLWCSVG